MSSPARIAIVLWSGVAGGTESVMSHVAAAMNEAGTPCEVIFVGEPLEMGERLDAWGVRYRALGLTPRRAMLALPRVAKTVSEAGETAAILPTVTWLAAGLRVGGYRGRVIAVDHGALVDWGRLPIVRRLMRRASRAIALGGIDVQVGVSDFALREISTVRHAPRLARVYNGVDTERFAPRAQDVERAECTFGFAARLVPGKGLPELLSALAYVREAGARCRLLVAGDGPEGTAARQLAGELGLEEVSFLGTVSDMPSFWRACDVAVVPTAGLQETFGMSAVEAMATGLPVIATRSGALPEVVAGGETGTIVAMGDAPALGDAMLAYAADPAMRAERGRAARDRCVREFDIKRTAEAYVGLATGSAERMEPVA